MITTELRRRHARPNVVAIFSFRYDAHLVPDLITNIAPVVDGWVAYDDRASTEVFSNEWVRRKALIETAQSLGARWILAIDPDERVERRLANRLPRLTRTDQPTAWLFRLREMYAPDRFRVDGLWRTKQRARLLSLHDDLRFDLPELHAPWQAIYPRYRLRDARQNLYHLKMITPDRRLLRRDLYKALDPDGRYQAVGYDYLADEDGLRLRKVGWRRRYDPPHHDDGGLWMPDLRGASE
ncbi:MAG: hypothetical protein IT534_02255 [Bauldia sp.]|nr:hypothetical protein [Bauldia sp.]